MGPLLLTTGQHGRRRGQRRITDVARAARRLLRRDRAAHALSFAGVSLCTLLPMHAGTLDSDRGDDAHRDVRDTHPA